MNHEFEEKTKYNLKRRRDFEEPRKRRCKVEAGF
jgi:hypothetical protein